MLFIQGLDIVQLSQFILLGKLTAVQFSDTIYKGSRKSISERLDMQTLLKQSSLNITLQRIDGASYYIEAERPNPYDTK